MAQAMVAERLPAMHAPASRAPQVAEGQEGQQQVMKTKPRIDAGIAEHGEG